MGMAKGKRGSSSLASILQAGGQKRKENPFRGAGGVLPFFLFIPCDLVYFAVGLWENTGSQQA
jgi:hypothetical protein